MGERFNQKCCIAITCEQNLRLSGHGDLHSYALLDETIAFFERIRPQAIAAESATSQ